MNPFEKIKNKRALREDELEKIEKWGGLGLPKLSEMCAAKRKAEEEMAEMEVRQLKAQMSQVNAQMAQAANTSWYHQPTPAPHPTPMKKKTTNDDVIEEIGKLDEKIEELRQMLTKVVDIICADRV